MYPKTKSIQKRLESEKECYWMCLYPDATFINHIDFNVYEKNIGKWCLKLLKEITLKKRSAYGVRENIKVSAGLRFSQKNKQRQCKQRLTKEKKIGKSIKKKIKKPSGLF